MAVPQDSNDEKGLLDTMNIIPIEDAGEKEAMVLPSLVLKPENCTPEAKRRISQSRRFSISGDSNTTDDPLDYKRVIHKKSTEELNQLRKACSNSYMFSGLDEILIKAAFDAMYSKNVKAGEIIIHQDDEQADYFYVIGNGIFEVTQSDDMFDVSLHTYENFGSFGEMALLYNNPRSATVTAKTDGTLWLLDRTTFRHVLVRSQANRRRRCASFIKTVPLFKSLNEIQLSKVADVLEIVQYEDMEYVIRQDSKGDSFYIIEDGCAIATQFFDGSEREIGRMGVGSFFGERALLLNQTRAANIKVWADVTAFWCFPKGKFVCFERLRCLRMDIASFKRIILAYDIRHILEKHIKTYKPACSQDPIVTNTFQVATIKDIQDDSLEDDLLDDDDDYL